MKNEIDQTGANEAQVVLDSIQEMENASLRRAVPPHWLGITVAVLTGVLFALAGMGIARIIMAPIFLLMILIIVYQTYKSGVLARPSPSYLLLIGALVATIAVCVPILLLVQRFRDTLGAWVPLSFAIAIAIAGYFAFLLERRMYFKRIGAEKIK